MTVTAKKDRKVSMALDIVDLKHSEPLRTAMGLNDL